MDERDADRTRARNGFMPPIDPDRHINCKIVYFGPAGSGKTTNLRYVHGATPATCRGDGVRLAGRGDRRHGFDLLPLDLGSIAGYATRFQLYSVPGAAHFQATRRLVLEGADGLVFVADSQRRQLDQNIQSLQTLRADLAARNVDMRTTPLVLQYNKRDLPADLLMNHGELEAKLNYRGVPSVEAEALSGVGVFETLEALTVLVLDKVDRERRVHAWT